MVICHAVWGFTAQQLWNASENAATALGGTFSYSIYQYGGIAERSTTLYEPMYQTDASGNIVLGDDGQAVPVVDDAGNWQLGPEIETLLLSPDGRSKTPMIVVNGIGVLVMPADGRTYRDYPQMTHSGLHIRAAFDLSTSRLEEVVILLRSVKVAVKAELQHMLSNDSDSDQSGNTIGGNSSMHVPMFEYLEGVTPQDDRNLQDAGLATLEQLVSKSPFELMQILGWNGHGFKVIRMMTHARSIASIPIPDRWDIRDQNPATNSTLEPNSWIWLNQLTNSFFWKSGSDVWLQVQ